VLTAAVPLLAALPGEAYGHQRHAGLGFATDPGMVAPFGVRPATDLPAGSSVFCPQFTQRLHSYRAHPVTYARLSPARLRAGMASMHPRARP
jgi:hypothetical protein